MSLCHRLLHKPSHSVLRRSHRFNAGIFARCSQSQLSCCGPYSDRSFPDTSFLSKRRFSANTAASSKSRLARTLYRGLMRWCYDTDDDIPLSSFVPPVHLSPPEINEMGLKALASPVESTIGVDDPQLEHIRDMLPKQSIIEPHQLTVPVRNSSDIRGLLRAIFRLHKYYVDDTGVSKKRTSLAFDTLKSLNELTAALEDLKKKHDEHSDRSGVAYSVGQVVQHKYDRWRGVIIDWRRTTRKEKVVPDIDVRTSLTQKDYARMQPVVEDETKEDIEYSLVLDIGDAHLLGGKRLVNDQSGVPVALQSDLQPVTEQSLCRVRSNWMPEYFDSFDASRNRFVPNETKNYSYPSDNSQLPGEKAKDEDVAKVGTQVVQGVQKLASQLEQCILDETAGLDSAGTKVLASLQERLSSLASGDVLSTRDRLSPKPLLPAALAIMHLRRLLSISLEIFEMAWQRRVSEMNKSRIRYSLGDIVQHKKYGFRGVVVAWDPKPAVDVSRWDGLAEIANPNELPFYHIIPDQNDCVRAFGGERPFRYVCEANLEKCPESNALLELDLDPEWRLSSSGSRYLPPDDLKFKYAEDLGGEGVASCVNTIKDEIGRLHVALRDSVSNPTSVEENISLKNLFTLLRASDSMDDAVIVEETIKEIWKAHSGPELRWRLDDGIADLLHGKKEEALNIFSELVYDDPEYAEAWNKKSTCHFMLGDMQASLEAAERTLELQPNHFQALNGLGLVQYETKRYQLSADSFRRSMQLDPWSPASSRLSLCLDVLKNMGVEEEGAAEGSAPYET